MTKPGVSKLWLGALVLLSACGRTELPGWLLAETAPASAESVATATSTTAGAVTGPGFTATTFPALTTVSTAAVTGGGGITASSSDVTASSAGGTTSTDGSSGEGGEGGEAPGELEVEPDALTPGRYKLEYGASFSASGGSGPYQFRVTAGELPPGLELAIDGTITGTPTFPGSWSFTLEVTDELGARAEQEYTLEVERNSLVALTVFLSSSSTRVDTLLLDLTQPGDGLLHRQDNSRFPQFSPDGRWLKWNMLDDQGTSDRYAQPLVDRTPLEQVPLAEDETDRPWCVWSPDSKRLGCALASSVNASFELGVRSVTDTSIEAVMPIADATAGDPRWLSPTRIVYTDPDSGLVAANFVGDEVTMAPYLQSLSDEAGAFRLITDYGSERGIVYTSGASPERTFVVDLATQVWHELLEATYWMFAPRLHLMLGWNGALSFLHAMDGTELLGPIDTSGAGSLAPEAYGPRIAMAPHAPRFAAVREERVIVSSVVAGVLENEEIAGAYASPRAFQFSLDGRWLALATDTGLWLTDLDSAAPLAAVKVADVRAASIIFAPDSSALAFVSEGAGIPNGGPPVTLGVVDLTHSPELETRLLQTNDEWGGPIWSNDASYLLFLGASVETGRALHVYDLLEPGSPQRFLVSCDATIGSSPGCPNGAEFQPWVSWMAPAQ